VVRSGVMCCEVLCGGVKWGEVASCAVKCCVVVSSGEKRCHVL